MIPLLTARARAFLRHDVLRFATLLAAAVFLLDWATKSWALQALQHSGVPVGALMLGVERNDAFALSTGAGVVPTPLLVMIRLASLAIVILLAARVGPRSRRIAAGFALLIAGGAGNLADLVFREGAVVDLIYAGPFRFGGEIVHDGVVFNGADIAILIALGLLAPLIQEWATGRQRLLAEYEARMLSSMRRRR
jgi:lipoprotein signal peptidase